MVLAVLALTPAGGWTWHGAAALASGLARPLDWLTAIVLFTAVVCALCSLATAPFTWYRLREVDTAYGRVPRSGRPSTLAFILVVAIGSLGALVVLAAATLAGQYWWIVMAAVGGAGLLAASCLIPRLVTVRGDGSLGRPALESRIADLARRAGVPVAAVQRWTVDEESTAVATVTGTGRARRVLVADEVAREWSDDEVVVIVAHELAHHVYRDLERTMVVDASVIAVAMFTADVTLRYFGGALGLGGPADPAALPLVALVVIGVWFVATPLRHAQSRHQERRADRWALSWTGQSGAFRTAIRRASARRMADENPGAFTRWLYHRHPPVRERLELAARHGDPTDLR
jgi:STE24 endopeptidase